ncbi:SH3 domain-containing protein [Paenibacillus spiritus]|uniref:SH3 domain-containing protein n=1 Tax=Paenibacillus spiritus TaxID=2496557 RepID=A0A5J5FXJ4_9BACL|nr:N-acetylmuramoyl-L-alanine amidase [Paenibacillus spiritus]KAA8998795.1 SH3 domain-containing protein [Paenibacillus spiritus]
MVKLSNMRVLGRRIPVLLLATLLALGVPAEAGAAYTAKVYTSSLPVLKEPAAGAAAKGYLKSGAVVTVTDEQHGWAKVSSGSLSGWVAGYYLKKTGGGTSAAPLITSAASAAASGRATITADSLRMRSGPGTGYQVIGSLNAGDRVQILSSENGWYRVRTAAGALGWAKADYVKTGGAAVTTAAYKTASASAPARTAGLRGKRIVVDAGHGGDDPGMVGTTYDTLEKDLNLQTALYLRDDLTAAGAQVTMTRTRDSQKPSLSSRALLSGKVGADAFVSVHYNSSPKNVSGTLTFYYSLSDDQKLARAIEGRLSGGIGLSSNGVSYGNYYVLRNNSVPSALVELGFLTTARDESIVRTAFYQRQAAQAIANGLADYFSR